MTDTFRGGGGAGAELEAYLNATARYATARLDLAKCEDEAGYEAGYFCQRYRDELESAHEECRATFEAAVRAALATAVKP